MSSYNSTIVFDVLQKPSCPLVANECYLPRYWAARQKTDDAMREHFSKMKDDLWLKTLEDLSCAIKNEKAAADAP